MSRSIQSFRAALSRGEADDLRRLTSPVRIQEFLDSVEYSADSRYRSPLAVVRDRKAHCYDGAVFAAGALSLLGYSPLIVNMFPNRRDDEHLVALFQRHGAWGAIGQSNFVGLRYREPIHRTLRELMISYFEQYYNVAREKTFRSYTRPFNLNRCDRLEWMTEDRALDAIAGHLSAMRPIPLLTRQMVRGLSPVDPQSYNAGLLGAVKEGLFKPK